MSEHIGNLGYFGLIKETTAGTPLTPTDFVPIYEDSLDTNGNLVDLKPAFGTKVRKFGTVHGIRSHGGDVTILAEPNTAARIFASLLKKTGTTGAGPYTHTLELNTSAPNSLTIDVAVGNLVKRFWGVQASKISPDWNDNEMQLKVSFSALGSFRSREISVVSTTTLTLADPDGYYNGNPSKGLVAGDLVRIYKSSTGAVLDTTVASVTDGDTVVLGDSAAAFAAGDTIQLRPATPDFTLLDSFLWSRTEFRFGDTAAAALTAAHTPVEQGSTFEITHEFKNSDGEKRSGSFDPASLVRVSGDASLKVNKYFDTTEDLQDFENLTKKACVIRHFAGSAGQYELRVTFNHIKTDGKIVPGIKPDDIAFTELDYHVVYDQTDAAAFSVTLVNELPTI